MTTPRAAAIGMRRGAQLIRAYRRQDIKAMNAVLMELEQERSGTETLYALLAFSSSLLDKTAPPDEIERLLSDLVLDYDEMGRQP